MFVSWASTGALQMPARHWWRVALVAAARLAAHLNLRHQVVHASLQKLRSAFQIVDLVENHWVVHSTSLSPIPLNPLFGHLSGIVQPFGLAGQAQAALLPPPDFWFRVVRQFRPLKSSSEVYIYRLFSSFMKSTGDGIIWIRTPTKFLWFLGSGIPWNSYQ